MGVQAASLAWRPASLSLVWRWEAEARAAAHESLSPSVKVLRCCREEEPNVRSRPKVPSRPLSST